MEGGLKGLRVLIVDDSFMMRRFIARSLSLVGVNPDNILEASRGEEALKFLGSPVDILFVDINMGGMDGFELIRRFRSLNGDVKVVVVTVDGSKPVMEEAMYLKVDAFLKKPFPPEEVRNTILYLAGRVGQSGAVSYVSGV